MNIRNCVLTSLLVLCSGISSTSLAVGTGYSDDTELFIYDFAKAGDFRPKVLFIFDNSGSMGSTTLMAKDEYDPEFSYPKLQYDDGSNNYLYYSTSGTPPDVLYSGYSKRFYNNVNACGTSKDVLNNDGLFSSVFWNYVESGAGNKKKGEWKPLKNYNENDVKIVECQQDITAKNNNNSSFSGSYTPMAGYPVNTTSTSVSKPWQDGLSPVAPATGGTESLTIYTANYLRWYHAPANISVSRLTVAKQALKELVRSTPAVDFGLAVFNRNTDGSNNGGRIIREIIGNDTILTNGKTGSQDLIDKSNSLTAETNTPLCETMYEAYRYFGGRDVYFGDDGGDIQPPRDLNAETTLKKYKSPYDKCSSNGYVIYMTDGAPTNDTAADSLVINLLGSSTDPNKPSYSGSVGYGSSNAKSYLAALAGYMKNNDVNTSSTGKQTVTTFTVGFGDEAIKGAGNLLAETARRGGGKYYPATDSTQLNEALKSSLLAILKMNTSLVSPAIATNNFDRTRSLNNIYYAMFEPGAGPRWKGNLKKLALAPEKGYVVDQSGMPAIASDGTILEAAITFWSSTSDGNKVAEGGYKRCWQRKLIVIFILFRLPQAPQMH